MFLSAWWNREARVPLDIPMKGLREQIRGNSLQISINGGLKNRFLKLPRSSPKYIPGPGHCVMSLDSFLLHTTCTRVLMYIKAVFFQKQHFRISKYGPFCELLWLFLKMLLWNQIYFWKIPLKIWKVGKKVNLDFLNYRFSNKCSCNGSRK